MQPTQPTHAPTEPSGARNPNYSAAATSPTPRPAPCPHCCGEGYLITTGPGYFDRHEECWMPDEVIDPCPACHGTGHQPNDWTDPDPRDTEPEPHHQDPHAGNDHLPAPPF